jgi:hypothetical protein
MYISPQPFDFFLACFTLQAKCGFLPSSEYISEDNTIKKQVTRYKMHQHLKFYQGEVCRLECLIQDKIPLSFAHLITSIDDTNLIKIP